MLVSDFVLVMWVAWLALIILIPSFLFPFYNLEGKNGMHMVVVGGGLSTSLFKDPLSLSPSSSITFSLRELCYEHACMHTYMCSYIIYIVAGRSDRLMSSSSSPSSLHNHRSNQKWTTKAASSSVLDLNEDRAHLNAQDSVNFLEAKARVNLGIVGLRVDDDDEYREFLLEERERKREVVYRQKELQLERDRLTAEEEKVKYARMLTLLEKEETIRVPGVEGAASNHGADITDSGLNRQGNDVDFGLKADESNADQYNDKAFLLSSLMPPTATAESPSGPSVVDLLLGPPPNIQKIIHDGKYSDSTSNLPSVRQTSSAPTIRTVREGSLAAVTKVSANAGTGAEYRHEHVAERKGGGNASKDMESDASNQLKEEQELQRRRISAKSSQYVDQMSDTDGGKVSINVDVGQEIAGGITDDRDNHEENSGGSDYRFTQDGQKERLKKVVRRIISHSTIKSTDGSNGALDRGDRSAMYKDVDGKKVRIVKRRVYKDTFQPRSLEMQSPVSTAAADEKMPESEFTAVGSSQPQGRVSQNETKREGGNQKSLSVPASRAARNDENSKEEGSVPVGRDSIIINSADQDTHNENSSSVAASVIQKLASVSGVRQSVQAVATSKDTQDVQADDNMQSGMLDMIYQKLSLIAIAIIVSALICLGLSISILVYQYYRGWEELASKHFKMQGRAAVVNIRGLQTRLRRDEGQGRRMNGTGKFSKLSATMVTYFGGGSGRKNTDVNKQIADNPDVDHPDVRDDDDSVYSVCGDQFHGAYNREF